MSVWDITQIDEIKNMENVELRWQNFIKSAPDNVLDQIEYNNELSLQLIEARRPENIDEEMQLLTIRDSYIAEIRPTNDDVDVDDIVPDNNYDWLQSK